MADAGVMAPPTTRMADLVRLEGGHLRSVRLDADLADAASSRRFVATPFVEATLRRLLSGLEPGSAERAWRLTGDYGTGKSSLMLALCRLVSGRRDELPASLAALAPPLRLAPVVVMGDREPVAVSMLRSLRAFAASAGLAVDIAGATGPPDAEAVFEALDAVAAAVRAAGLGEGVLLVLDELGKNLEHAALSPEVDDVFLLQGLAERAVRSGAAPLMVVAVLHQAVAGYAAGLSSVARREWEKVAGRFGEIVFAPPIEQSAVLVAAALDVDLAALPAGLAERAEASMRAAVRLGWYGAGAGADEMAELAPALFPLDPMALPVLARVLRRFGQNERSLFGFLSSAEPGGLMDLARRPLADARLYGLPELYDYVGANLASQVGQGAASGRWAVVDAVVRSGVARTADELAVLKSVGIVNLLDDPMLAATTDVVASAVAGGAGRQASAEAAVDRLRTGERVLYERGAGAGLCLWPNSSVDLDDAFRRGQAAMGPVGLDRLVPLLPADPLVARRHYAETGALRHFERVYAPVERLAAAASASPAGADGRIVVALCDDAAERERAVAIAEGLREGLGPTTLLAVPQPVGALLPMLRDVEAWRWVRGNAEGLAGDRVARDEVARQLLLASDALARLVSGLVERPDTVWFGRSGSPAVGSGRQLYSLLSDVCDDAFDLSPLVRNELINRRTLSSAAARARYLVIEALATAPGAAGLGIQADGVPPERALYLSMLERGGVHVRRGAGWAVVVPPEGADPLRLRPSLELIGGMLRQAGDGRVPYEAVIGALRGGRYGVREGLAPLLVAIYLAAHWHHTAVYEDGTYLDQVGGPEFNRMVKESEHFELQHCAIEGVRAEVFARLAAAVGVTPGDEGLDLLDVVRPMTRFLARLPDHAVRTRRLSVGAVAMRDALLAARDPKVMVFRDLPAACGLEPIGVDGAPSAAEVSAFVEAVRRGMRELRDAYPELLARLRAALATGLECADGEPGGMRAGLAARADAMLPTVTEAELRTLLLRLADRALDEQAWIESLASAVVRKPPERWNDIDEADFHHRLGQLARRFRRVEAAVFRDPSGDALRLVVTSGDGREVEDVLRPGTVAPVELEAAEAELRAVLGRHGRAGALAAARLLLEAAGRGG